MFDYFCYTLELVLEGISQLIDSLKNLFSALITDFFMSAIYNQIIIRLQWNYNVTKYKADGVVILSLNTMNSIIQWKIQLHKIKTNLIEHLWKKIYPINTIYH